MAPILVIYNPIAGQRRGPRFRATLAALESQGAQVVLQATQKRGDAEAMAREAARAGVYSVIAVAGGDGTINEAANGLTEFPLQKLGIIPLGTANVLAQEIGLKPCPEVIARTITATKSLTIYPGLLNERRFLLMVSLGLDSFVVSNLDSEMKKKIGPLAYVIGGIKAGLTYSFPSIQAEGKSCYGIIVAKAQHYGGPFIVAPDVSLTQPNFQVLYLEKPGIIANLNYSWAILRSSLARKVPSQILEQLEIIPPSNLACQVDGDEGLISSSLQIRVDKTPLSLLVP